MERLETPQPAPTPPVQAPHPSPSRLIEAKARVQQARQAAAYQSLTHSLQVSREAERLRQAQQGRRRAQGEA